MTKATERFKAANPGYERKEGERWEFRADSWKALYPLKLADGTELDWSA